MDSKKEIRKDENQNKFDYIYSINNYRIIIQFLKKIYKSDVHIKLL